MHTCFTCWRRQPDRLLATLTPHTQKQTQGSGFINQSVCAGPNCGLSHGSTHLNTPHIRHLLSQLLVSSIPWHLVCAHVTGLRPCVPNACCPSTVNCQQEPLCDMCLREHPQPLIERDRRREKHLTACMHAAPLFQTDKTCTKKSDLLVAAP